MAFEDALRNVTDVLAMTFNPEVAMAQKKMEYKKRQDAIEQLSQGIQSGAIDPTIGNQKLQQLGGQAVGPNQLTLDRQRMLADKQAEEARVQELRPQVLSAIQSSTLPEANKASLAATIPAADSKALKEMQIRLGFLGQGAKGGGAKGGESGKVGLTSDAIDKLADEYHQTGTLPSLGMASKGDKEAIINRERSKYPTSTGGDMVVNRVVYKANSMGLNALTKDIVAITPYKDMLDKNVDIAIDLSKKVVMSDSKLANKSLNWLKQNVGDNPDAAEYLAQMRFVQTEAARVLNNPRLVGQLTDTARQEMEQVVSGDMPLGASTRVLQRIKKDGENRVAAMISAQNELSKKIGGSTVTPEKKPTTSGWSAKIVNK